MTSKQEQGARNKAWGKKAEQIAYEYLATHGYTIREQNWRMSNHTEIDIIAQKGDEMVFIEVKARSGRHSDAVTAVDRQKRIKMLRGSDHYLKQQDFRFRYRFDIIAITGDENDYKIEHLEDAFLPPLNGKY